MNTKQLLNKISEELDYNGEVEYCYFGVELITIPFPKVTTQTEEEFRSILPPQFDLVVAKTPSKKVCIIINRKSNS